jgi:multiple antibiotic resistance protein
MWWQNHLSEFVTLLLVINPFEVLPIFIALAGALEPALQRKIAFKAVVVAFVTLVFFIFSGDFLLKHLGVSIRAFQIAGGIVLFLLALEMLRGEEDHGPPGADPSALLALAVYPLGIPKIAGPGAILAVIFLTDDDRFNLMGQLATVGVLAVVLTIQFLVLFAAGPIARLIGAAGIGVIGRIMGLLLAALAVSMVLTAVADWLALPKI